VGALDLRLADVNERLAASSASVAELERLTRRRDAILETADEVRGRLEEATRKVRAVEAEVHSSPALFRFAVHRRRLEGFLERPRKEGFVAAALYLVLEHELSSLGEELAQLEERIQSLSGSLSKHAMLVEWRDELLMEMGGGRLTAAAHALERVSAAVEVASRAADVESVADAREVAVQALADLEEARRALDGERRIEKDDLAALADLIPEGTRHFALREAKRKIEQATLRLGFVNDELRSVDGLAVKLRHPYFAMEAFLGGLFDDFHSKGLVVDSLALVEESQGYVRRTISAIEGAREVAGEKLEAARAQEAQTVGQAVGRLRPVAGPRAGPIRVRSRYSTWDEVPLRR
jgi:hypothetical protein